MMSCWRNFFLLVGFEGPKTSISATLAREGWTYHDKRDRSGHNSTWFQFRFANRPNPKEREDRLWVSSCMQGQSVAFLNKVFKLRNLFMKNTPTSGCSIIRFMSRTRLKNAHCLTSHQRRFHSRNDRRTGSSTFKPRYLCASSTCSLPSKTATIIVIQSIVQYG